MENNFNELSENYDGLLKKHNNLINNVGIPFVKTSKEEIILNNQKFIYKKFYQELLGNPKYPNSASSVYLEPIGDKILAASADGIIFYFNKFDLNQENFKEK